MSYGSLIRYLFAYAASDAIHDSLGDFDIGASQALKQML
jgi:hypothetical protein